MENNQDKIIELQQKIDVLLEQHKAFAKEIQALKSQLFSLKYLERTKDSTLKEEENKTSKQVEELYSTKQKITAPPISEPIKVNTESKDKPSIASSQDSPKKKTDIERFIGENLISKIGIIITVIGVGIGVKYSIENELVSPLTRIVLGYLSSIGLLGFGMKLKEKYETYSAVLVSGAMSLMYFITFSAYSFYDLIPVELTFGLMVVFTVFTTFAALSYNKSVIAHLGLVGAYAIPFLLSDGSGKVQILFSYVAIVNVGILVVAFKKYWKSLYYSSFFLTWIIYLTWYFFDYSSSEHFWLAIAFSFVFFITFYLIFLAYKLIEKVKFDGLDIFFLILNTFIFYALGYAILSSNESSEDYLGLYTLMNAILHFVICVVVFKQKLADKNLFYFISGLVLVFITIAIPVQLDGNWVTLLWVSQAALLFWIGRTKQISVYENLSYPLMILAFLSILQDWDLTYQVNLYQENAILVTPIWNIHFLSSLFFAGLFGYITKLDFEPTNAENVSLFSQLFSFGIPAIFVFSLYYGIRLEIENYWNILYLESTLPSENDYGISNLKNRDLDYFKIVWVFIYTLVFVSILNVFNFKKLRHKKFSYILLVINCVTILVFLVQGLYALSELRESYLNQSPDDNYIKSIWHIIIRYLALVVLGVTLYLSNLYVVVWPKIKKLKRLFYSFLHLSILWVLSSELLHWLDIADVKNTYKLGLSILWGLYSLYLIILGIWKKSKFLRVTAIVLFSITIIKLFVFDISHLNTISKTIVFVSIGVLLLITSFLYHKYNKKISDESQP